MTAKKISLIVEGEGEEKAAPALINRLLRDHFQRYDIFTNTPKKAKGRNNLMALGGFEYYIDACLKFDYQIDGILVLLDADDDCPVQLAKGFYERIEQKYVPVPIFLVCAKCEYEAWFLANVDALIENGYLTPDASYPIDKIEEKRGVKEWLSANMPEGRRYKETIDQAKMTSLIHIGITQKWSDSFQHLTSSLGKLIKKMDEK